MAFNLTQFQEETKDAFLELPNKERINFSYYPNRYTPEHEDKVAEARESGRKGGAVLKAWLIPLVSKWDIVTVEVKADGEGKPVLDSSTGEPVREEVEVPITEEGLSIIPYEVLAQLLNTIIEDMSPGEPTGTASKGSFS